MSAPPPAKRARSVKALEGDATPTAAESSSETAAALPAVTAQEDEEVADAESPEETWADLKELWEEAMSTLANESPESAAPLLRGLCHECDRIERNSEDASRPLGATTGEQGKDGELTCSSFFLVYGTSLLSLGQLLSLHPTLSSSVEPPSIAFFRSALAQLDKARAALPVDASDWRLDLAHGRTLVELAGWLFDHPVEKKPKKKQAKGLGKAKKAAPADDEAPQTTPVDLIEQAVAAFHSAIEAMPDPPSSSAPSDAAASPPKDPSTSFLPSSLTSASHLATRLLIPSSLAPLLDRLPPSPRQRSLAEFLEHVWVRAAGQSGLSSAQKYEVHLGRGAMWLGIGSGLIETMEEGQQDEDAKLDLASEAAQEARAVLSRAVDELKAAKALNVAPAPVAGKKEEEEGDGLAPMVVEACLSLSGLLDRETEDGEKQALELEKLATEAGWEGDDDDDVDE